MLCSTLIFASPSLLTMFPVHIVVNGAESPLYTKLLLWEDCTIMKQDIFVRHAARNLPAQLPVSIG